MRDRVVRVAVGVFVLSLIFWGPRTLWGLVGLVPLVAGLSGRCPAFVPFGAGSCATSDSERAD